jgi:Rrf2 family nitric oxide-sensitive transcriptional repressor
MTAKKSWATELWYGVYHNPLPQSMTLNLFTDYSLRVLMYAALPDRERFSLDDVSSAYGISRDHVAKVVQRLVHVGYLTSQRGRGGGISLARPASEIRVGDVVRETQGHSPLVECFHPPTNTCRLMGSCRLQGVLREAANAFQSVLDRYTLADLVAKPRPLTKILAA